MSKIDILMTRLQASLRALALAVSATLAVPSCCFGQTNFRCDELSIASKYSAANAAIDSWLRKNGIGMTASVRQNLLTKFCLGAENTSALYGTSQNEINAASGEIISKYLGDGLSGNATMESLADRMSDQFGLGASAGLPEPKALGILKISYAHTVDKLQINGDYIEPSPVLMVIVGALTIEGSNAGQIICRGSLTITTVAAANFQC